MLCWLATSFENEPNVSPKYIFTTYGEHSIILANIASPKSVSNIKKNNKVCLSFIDVLMQKGYQVYGTAEIIKSNHTDFNKLSKDLLKIPKGKFPFSSIIKIIVKKNKPIIAPIYILFPETTEQIESAKKTYSL